MKRLLTLLLLLPLFAIAQDTHTLPSGTIQIPAGALRYKGVTPDSLNQLWLSNTLTGKSNRIFTATESNLLFAPIVGGGYVPTTRTLTIAGVTYDLSANRIWTLATHSLGYGLSGSTYNGSTGVSWAVDSTLLVTKTFAARYPLKSLLFSNGYGMLGFGDLSANRTPSVDTSLISTHIRDARFVPYDNWTKDVTAGNHNIALGTGYYSMSTLSGKPTGVTGETRMYRDSVGRWSYMNGLYRRTFAVRRSVDNTITYPWKLNPTLVDSLEASVGYIRNTTSQQTSASSYIDGTYKTSASTKSITLNPNGTFTSVTDLGSRITNQSNANQFIDLSSQGLQVTNGTNLQAIKPDRISYINSGNTLEIKPPLTITGNFTATLQNATGTLALTSDITTALAPYLLSTTAASTYVPLTRTVATFPLSSDVTLATLSAANGILMGNYNGSTGRTVALDTSIAVSKIYAGRYVPYDGATKNLDLGANLLIAGQVRASNLSSTMVKATSIGTLTAATSGTDYEPALTFNGGLSRTSNTISVDQGYGFNWTAAQTFGANILLGANNTYSIGSNTNNLSTVYTRSLSANAALTFNTTSTDALIFKTNGVERFRTDGSTGNTTFGTNVDNNRGLVQVEGFATIKQTRFGAIGVDSLMGHATNGDLVRFAPDAYLTPAAASALFITPSSGNTLTNKSISGATNTLTAIPNSALTNSTISGISLGSNLAALTATDATLTFSGSYNGGTARTVGVNTANAFTWTGVNTYQFNALGASTTDATAYVNSTAAISGTQQVSPGTRWSGNGFGTTAGTSQAVEFRAYVSPSQGTTASGSWTLQSQVNGGGWSDRLFLSSGGNFTIGGMVASSRTAVGTGSTDGLVAANTTAATSGSTVQNSTRVRWSGAAWNTTATAATNTMEAVAELVPVSGSSPSSIWRLGFQNSTLASGLSYPFTVTSAGAITATSYTGGAVLTGTPTVPNVTAGTLTTQAVNANYVESAITGYGANVFNISANRTFTGADFAAAHNNSLDIYVDSSAGNVTVTLMAANFGGAPRINVTKTSGDANTVTIASASAVWGGTTLTTQFQTREFMSNATAWYNH